MKNIAECHRWLKQAIASTDTRPPVDDFKKKITILNLLPKKTNVICITGTNGKGTTTMLLEEILQQAGYRTGSFISPHLCQLNERVRVNGATIDEKIFLKYFNEIQSNPDVKDVHWFGFLLTVALAIFRQFPLDFLIMEAGVGGKKCLTNALEPILSIITTVALDHMEILGDTREQIGVQKAGLFRPHKPAICGDPDPPMSVVDYAQEVEAPLYIQARNFSYQIKDSTWSWQGFGHHLINLPKPKMPLQNASTVLAAVMTLNQQFNISEEIIRMALANVFVPGRYQLVANAPLVICDVAHNPQAVAWLAHQLTTENFTGQTFVVVAMKVNKAIPETLTALNIPVVKWFIADLTEEEGFVQQAHTYLQHRGDEVCIATSVLDAFKKAKAIATENDRIVVFGSFRTVGQIFSISPSLIRGIT